ncbi:hypothetical protein [Paenibacillus taichungensis]|uniref:hypothetical protein n=1 Tax=Paenibacillus taichungensis TaxID=484184 RepID=UPI003D9A3104
MQPVARVIQNIRTVSHIAFKRYEGSLFCHITTQTCHNNVISEVTSADIATGAKGYNGN